MKKLSYIILLSAFSGCNLNSPPTNQLPTHLDSIKISRDTLGAVQEYKGIYREHTAQFTICGETDVHVIHNREMTDSIYDHLLPNAYVDQPIYLELKARPDLNDAAALIVTEVTNAEQLNHKNSCLFSEYWIFGTEPFWTIQISKAGDLIDFYDPMNQHTEHFSFVDPKIKAGVTYFDATDGQNTLNIRIKKEKCSGAIDPQYDFSAQVSLNGKEFHGCVNAYYQVKATDAIQ